MERSQTEANYIGYEEIKIFDNILCKNLNVTKIFNKINNRKTKLFDHKVKSIKVTSFEDFDKKL